MDRPGTVIEVTLDHDVVDEIERLGREQGLDVDEAVNLLARRGIASRGRPSPTSPGGSEVVEILTVSDAGAPFHPRD